MLIFYAYNNANIITMANLKFNLYQDQQGILLIRGTQIISHELVKSIRKNDIFDKVLVVDIPIINMKTIKFHNTKVLKQYVKTEKINNYYTNFLGNNIGEINVDRIFVNGGWNDSCYVINYFYQINNKIQVCMVEEGTTIYSLSRKYLLKMRPGLNWKGRFVNSLVERKYQSVCEKQLSKEVYTYSEKEFKRLNEDRGAEPIELPQICENNAKIKEVLLQSFTLDYNLKNVYDIIKIIYDKRKVVFLADYVYEDEQIRFIKLMINKIKPSQIIIKPHTGNTAHKLNFAKEIKQKYGAVYVDRNTYYFEGMNTSVDFSEKVLVSRGSGIMLYMKLIYGREPYLIFTYKLYNEYKTEGDIHRIGDLVDMIRNLYNDKSRIMVPESIDQFEEMIEYAYIQSLGY